MYELVSKYVVNTNQVKVGWDKLVGEVIKLESDTASI